jgi:tRNA A-37 threonylcarbamoyl transferase component Bud32
MKTEPELPLTAAEVFNRALEIADLWQREAYLAEVCAGKEALRQEVERLLGHHRSDSFMERPAGQYTIEFATNVPRGEVPELPVTLKYFGDYELLEEIARGGMGVVWKARQKSLNRLVAVKMILSGHLATAADVKRFHTEAEAAANLQHPNIVAIHEIGEQAGRHYFSMDYVAGRDLAELIKEKPLSPAEAAKLLQTIAEAVHYAHQRGTLHRDLKPHNVLINESGAPRITDFGLAKQLTNQSEQTQSGTVMGSPSYMPPEQALGRLGELGPASDVYSLGAILYQMLTGRVPFQGATAVETLQQVVEQEPAAPTKLNPAVPPDLETICLKCLEKKPERRYASARALAEELGRFLNHEPILAKPPNPIRRGWMWLRKHPWAITGITTFVLLGFAGLAYGLAEEISMLRWKLANGDAQRFTGDDFFPDSVWVFLFIEFFLFQSLPWVLFNRRLSKAGLTEHQLLGLSFLGVIQIWLGLWIMDTGLRYEIWVDRFGRNMLLWATASFSNVWFGSTLAYRCLSAVRGLHTEQARTGGTQSLSPIMNQPSRLSMVLYAEAVLMGTIMLCSVPSLTFNDEGGGAAVLIAVITLSFLLTLLVIAIGKPCGKDFRASLLRLILVLAAIATTLVTLGLSAQSMVIFGPLAPIPCLLALVLGLVTGSACVSLKLPTREIGKPVYRVESGGASVVQATLVYSRLSLLLAGEALILALLLWDLKPWNILETGGQILGDGAALLLWTMVWTGGWLTLIGLLKSRGVARTIFIPPMLLCGFIVWGMGDDFATSGIPTHLVAGLSLMGCYFGHVAMRMGAFGGGEFPVMLFKIRDSLQAKHLRRVAISATALVLFLLLAEKVRGHRHLSQTLVEMKARGQATDIRELFLVPSKQAVAFTNELSQIMTNFGFPPLLGGGGNLVDQSAGFASRGSQAKRPVWVDSRLKTNSWSQFAERLDTNRVHILRLHALLADAPEAWPFELSADRRPNYGNRTWVSHRTAAQWLNDWTVLALHRDDLPDAERHLLALGALMRMNARGPTLVDQMLRVAIEGIATSALWDALQADGWTDAQLKRLQGTWQVAPLVSDVVRAMESERLFTLDKYRWFSAVSYSEWFDYHRQFHDARAITDDSLRIPRNYLFHPIWQFAWAEQEMALYLKRSEFLITQPRVAWESGAFASLSSMMGLETANLHENGPLSLGRYYLELPFNEIYWAQNQPPINPTWRILARSWSGADFSVVNFSKAFSTATRNEVMREMAVAAIALKRHQLRHGKLPEKLEALVPEFLAELPHDWWDGKPLRYRLNPDGSYLLYSVGEDGKDEDGDPTYLNPKSPGSGGRDQVWPRFVPWTDTHPNQDTL